MSETTEIHGTCHPRFERTRKVFQESLDSGAEIGAAVSVVVDGESVVDLWAGFRNKERTLPWERETLVNVYSTTKGLTALSAHRLIDEGRLELDTPVARYWPEFGAAGKQDLPVRYLLSHQAGLAAVRKPLPPGALYEWDTMTAALAEQEPWWEPGARHGYHALTFGWLVGEVVRRITGKSVGTYVREEIAEPLGVEFHIGCPPELDARIADLVQGPIHEAPDGQTFDLVQQIMNEPESLFAKAFANPPILDMGAGNSREWRAAEIPAANGHTNAASLARIYGALACGGSVDGVRVLSPEGIERARTEHCCGDDAVLPMFTRIGLGFFMPAENEPTGPNPQVFGHGGAGGSYSQADPEARMGFGYVMNHMHQGLWLVDPRPRALLAAVYESL